MKTPGERLREAREAKRLTREALAAQVGCCVTTLRNYERGATEPGLDILRRVCRALGIKTGEVIG